LSIVVEPVAEGVPFTEDVELIVVALRSKNEASAKEKSLAVDDAVPVSVAGKGELAVSVNRPVFRPSAGRLREASESVTLYGGGADPAAGNTGPIVIGNGVDPSTVTVSAMSRTVDELEMVFTAALAGDTEAKPAESANTLRLRERMF
jgi:hypothetical protein